MKFDEISKRRIQEASLVLTVSAFDLAVSRLLSALLKTNHHREKLMQAYGK